MTELSSKCPLPWEAPLLLGMQESKQPPSQGGRRDLAHAGRASGGLCSAAGAAKTPPRAQSDPVLTQLLLPSTFSGEEKQSERPKGLLRSGSAWLVLARARWHLPFASRALGSPALGSTSIPEHHLSPAGKSLQAVTLQSGQLSLEFSNKGDFTKVSFPGIDLDRRGQGSFCGLGQGQGTRDRAGHQTVNGRSLPGKLGTHTSGV